MFGIYWYRGEVQYLLEEERGLLSTSKGGLVSTTKEGLVDDIYK